MLITKKTNKTIFIAPLLKFKKKHKSFIKPQVYNARNSFLYTSTFGIKAKECAKITHKQNENFRRNLVRKFKKIIISFKHALNPNWPFSQKSRGTRMGKGKGPVGYWAHRLSSAAIPMHFYLPNIINNLIFYKQIYKSMCKSLNFGHKLITNNHLLQEQEKIVQNKQQYWKL